MLSKVITKNTVFYVSVANCEYLTDNNRKIVKAIKSMLCKKMGSLQKKTLPDPAASRDKLYFFHMRYIPLSPLLSL